MTPSQMVMLKKVQYGKLSITAQVLPEDAMFSVMPVNPSFYMEVPPAYLTIIRKTYIDLLMIIIPISNLCLLHHSRLGR